MIWTVSRATRQAPSELLGVRAWASERLGMPDFWTALQFDAAVSYFGNWIESRLNEFDPVTHKPRYTLQGLLAEEMKAVTVHDWIDRMRQFKGVVGTVKVVK